MPAHRRSHDPRIPVQKLWTERQVTWKGKEVRLGVLNATYPAMAWKNGRLKINWRGKIYSPRIKPGKKVTASIFEKAIVVTDYETHEILSLIKLGT